MNHLPMPTFGPLAGVRVVFSGIEIAGPFAGQMFAEWGAEVIWIENVAWADTIRVQPNYPQLSRRNLHALSLNIFKDEGREAFLKLMETTDIFIEASKGPAFARRGITDEVLWEHNPKLVIAHLSGFGQYGTEEYTNLPAYNTIAQAFSGYLIQNGDVDQPMPAFPYTADYFSGMTATTAALAALHKVRETGKGESIDIAMYEVM
ncbi:L-carnitine CoA-transferase, partial [Salmonella enterica]|nr:L-carnitine CoA-transferase [Salmonella enterica]